MQRLNFSAETNLETVAATLRNNPLVEFVEPNYLIKADEVSPDDPQFAEQWALRNATGAGSQSSSDIGAARAWDATTGSEKTLVAVIDSGIDFTHPDLKANQWTNRVERRNNKDDDLNGRTDDLNGWDWVAQSSGGKDESGHGTAVAGIIAAHGNNRLGISGVMWRAGLMNLRVLDGTGTGDVAAAVEAIDYAVAHGAHVINCSWGTDFASGALAKAVERAGRRGVMIIASAGNSGSNIDAAPHYPASYNYPHVVSVASTDKNDQLTSWSNWGATRATIAAPGVEILSTKMGGGYEQVSGSSASTALATGVVGLIKTLRPRLKAESVRAMLLKGSRLHAALDGKVSTGGILSAGGSTITINTLAPGEGSGERSEDGTSDSTPGSNPFISPQGRANNPAQNGRRVKPLFEVSDLPDLNQVGKVQSRAPRAPKPIPSTLRRNRPNSTNGNRNSRSPNGDSGTTTAAPRSASADSGERDLIPAKYYTRPRRVLIAANHMTGHGTFNLPIFKYLEGETAASTSDAPHDIAWSYSSPDEGHDPKPLQARSQPESINKLIGTLSRFNRLLLGSVPALVVGNDAAFVSQSVPIDMVAGQPYTVTVKMQNTGSTTWTADESYRLGSRLPQDNSNWGFGRVALPAPVAPNQEVVFTFQVTAPATPDIYHFQWQMVRDTDTGGWFGEPSADTLVNVGSNAAFVSQTVPTVMQAGQTYPVSVTMINTGPVTWTSENLYSLGARNSQDNSTWGANSGRTPLPSPVGPNQQVTFNFNVTAPSTPGVYNFQRQMVKDGLSWF
ncbi:MAG TPA: S8 family serine peptidase, partial [Tepidisphaeraceae bacterium]